jgi:hypothetical protein
VVPGAGSARAAGEQAMARPLRHASRTTTRIRSFLFPSTHTAFPGTRRTHLPRHLTCHAAVGCHAGGSPEFLTGPYEKSYHGSSFGVVMSEVEGARSVIEVLQKNASDLSDGRGLLVQRQVVGMHDQLRFHSLYM